MPARLTTRPGTSPTWWSLVLVMTAGALFGVLAGAYLHGEVRLLSCIGAAVGGVVGHLWQRPAVRGVPS